MMAKIDSALWLDSQFASLEPPGPEEQALALDVAAPPDALVAHAAAWLVQQG